MRIDLHGRTPQTGEAGKVERGEVKTRRSVGRGTQSGDHADISAGAAQVASLTAKAMQSTEVRQNKVNALAAAVSSGSYEVPAEKAAEAMVSEMLARASVIR